MGLGRVSGRRTEYAEERKASKDIKGKRSQKSPYCLEAGHRGKEEPGGSQVLGESGKAADLQE